MSEIICPLCKSQSPEQAMYCQQCGQPLRCKECNTALLPTARACIQCGKLIPERSANEKFYTGMDTILPGYNRLKLHETSDVRDVDLTISNEAIAHIGDLFPSLVGTRPKEYKINAVDHQLQKQSDLIEVNPETPSSQTQLPLILSQPSLAKNISEDSIWKIFRKHDEGVLKQDISGLKASGKKDYTMRLVYLYMYAKFQLSEEEVPRAEVYTFLDNVNLKDNNIARYMAQANGISSDEAGTLRLNYEGRKQAQQYIEDVFNSALTDSWLPSSDAHSSSNKTKKSSKKSIEQHSSSDKNVAIWVSNPISKELFNAIEHGTIVALPLIDKTLLALYGIYKTGHDQEVPLAAIIKYLYDAFEVLVESNALGTALYRLREEKKSKDTYINFRQHSGYKITPSGRKYIEDLLKLKQAQTSITDENAG